jgi:hypothetical protein
MSLTEPDLKKFQKLLQKHSNKKLSNKKLSNKQAQQCAEILFWYLNFLSLLK